MKRSLVLLLCLLLFLTACDSEGSAPVGEAVEFFYPAIEPYGKGSFLSVTRYFAEGLPTAGELLQQYLSDPVPEGAYGPVPEGWTFRKGELREDGTFVVEFSGSVAKAVEETVAAACLTKTLSRLEEVLRLELLPPGGRDSVILSVNDILSEDLPMQPKAQEVVLYYPDVRGGYLRRETRTVEDMTADQLPEYIVRQLLQGTAIGEPHGCIPEGTELLLVQNHNGICTLNLSSEFSQDMPEELSVVRLALYSLVNSLTELREIHTVDIQVAYAPLDRLYVMDLRNGLTQDDSMIYQEDRELSRLYLLAEETGTLAEIPLFLTSEEGLSQEEQLLRQLLSCEGGYGLRNPVPEGTSVLSVRTAEGLCVVDLTAAFLGENRTKEEEEAAVKSIVATLCALPHIRSVEILVEGLTPEYLDLELQQIHAVDPAWICP